VTKTLVGAWLLSFTSAIGFWITRKPLAGIGGKDVQYRAIVWWMKIIQNPSNSQMAIRRPK